MVSQNAIICPHCSGQNVQLLSVIHAAGTSHIKASHQAQSGFGPRVTVETTSRHQTALAESVGPPPGKRLLGPVILTGVGGIILYDGLKLMSSWGVDWARFFIGVIFIGVGVIGFVRHWKFNVAQYDKLEEWRRTWMCHACGTRFQPS